MNGGVYMSTAKRFIVTIGREYGSGGRIIGRKLAEELGVNFYDYEMIDMIVNESGLTNETVKKLDGQRTSSFLYSTFMSTQTAPLSDKIFFAQSKVIKDLAQKESFVIVGRCGDYVLKDVENCLNVFIYAPMEERIKRVQNEYGEKLNNYESYIKKQDKKRADYYNYFTPNKWGDRANYHVMIDSSIGVDYTVKMLKGIMEALNGGEE
jgi:cytidylate kinase